MGRKHKKKQESKRPVEAENNSEYAPSMAEEPSVSEPTAVAPPSLESSPEVGADAAPAKRSSIRNSLSSVFRRLSAGNVARNETEGAPLLSSSVGAEEETSAETGPCITETISNTAESYAEKVDSDSNEIEDNNSTLPPTKRSSIRNSFSKLVRRLSGDGGVGEDSAPLLSSLGVSERNDFLDEEKKDLEADRIHLKGGQNHAEDLEDNRSNIKKGVTFSADIEDAYFPPPSNRSSLRSSGDNWRIHTSVTKSEDQWAMEGDEDIIALAPLNEKEEKENDSKLLGRAQVISRFRPLFMSSLIAILSLTEIRGGDEEIARKARACRRYSLWEASVSTSFSPTRS